MAIFSVQFSSAAEYPFEDDNTTLIESSTLANKVNNWDEIIKLYPNLNDPILIKYGHHVIPQNRREMEGLSFWMKISKWRSMDDDEGMGFSMSHSIDHSNSKAVTVYLTITTHTYIPVHICFPLIWNESDDVSLLCINVSYYFKCMTHRRNMEP